MTDLTDEQIQKYVSEALNESIIREYEDHFLLFLKTRWENNPTEKHDRDWLTFTDWVIERRKYERKNRD